MQNVLDYPLSVSQRATLRRCPHKWWWSYVDGLRASGVRMPLWFGIGIHLALAEYYPVGTKRGRDPVETWLEYCEEDDVSTSLVNVSDEDGEKAYEDAKTLGVGMLKGYTAFYGDEPEWEWIANEQGFMYKVPPWGQRILRKGTKPLGSFRGFFDGVKRNLVTGEIVVAEHKTSRDNSTLHLPIDPQATGYLMVAQKFLRKEGLIGSTEKVVGIEYNFLQKKLPPEDTDELGRPLLKPTKDDFIEAIPSLEKKMKLDEMRAVAVELGVTVKGKPSTAKREPLFVREMSYRTDTELRNALRGLQSELLYREALVTGTVPVFKNPTKDCGWDCDFYRMCQLHEAGEDWEEYRDEKFESSKITTRPEERRKSA